MSGAPAHRYTVAPGPGADREVLAARLWVAGALGVWEHPDALVAWFDAPTDAVPAGGAWELEPDRDWQAEWKASIGPVRAGRVTIVPTWLAAQHDAAPDEVVLVLDPGRAFGSGHHATTVMCLELLQDLADEGVLGGASVLDIGCGTGVLALAALRLGAAAATAVDVDPDAIEVTRENAGRNPVAGLATRVGSVDPARDRADVVMANLLTDTIAGLATALAATVRPGGRLVASGIAADRADAALRPLAAAGLDVTVRRERDGWVALVARRRPT